MKLVLFLLFCIPVLAQRPIPSPMASGSIGTVTSVSGTANEITSTGGATPVLSIANTFDISGKTSTAPIKKGTSAPATCAVGEFFNDTDATAGQNLLACTAVNTWTTQGAPTPPSAPANSIQYNNGGAFGGSADLTWNGTTVQVNTTGDSAHAFRSELNLTGSNWLIGFYNNAITAASVTATDLWGAYFENVSLGAGATLTNQYGIQVADLTSATNNYAIKTGLGLVDIGDNVKAASYSSQSNCADSAGAAACGSAPAGSFVVDAGSTSTVVSTTAVTANSQIFVTFDASLGTRLGITCNSTIPALYGVTARTAATSFTLTSSAPVTNPACFNYWIVN